VFCRALSRVERLLVNYVIRIFKSSITILITITISLYALVNT
jgi:hypothetical protein